ncbi:MAG: AAA family ATPase, partial [Chloroflexota bacterium]|nr:AAA family ATPase [Chloroflexota bacterium]
MTFDKWQAPDRDSPQILSLDVDVDLGRQLQLLLQMDGRAGTRDEDVQMATGEALPRARRWHKIFERMGLLYPDGDGNTRITGLGRTLAEAKSQEETQMRRRLATLAIAVLRKYQLKNPADEDGDKYPDACDIHPYWAIWKAAVDLGGRVHWDELNRELMWVLTHEDLQPAIDRIRDARSDADYDARAGGSGRIKLRERAYQQGGAAGHDADDQTRDQITTPWFKRATLGGFLLEAPGAGGGGYWTVPADFQDLLAAEVRTPPPFYKAQSEQDWFRYYGAVPGADEREDLRSQAFGPATEAKVAEIVDAANRYGDRAIIALSGVPGTGKTLLARVAAERLAGDSSRVKEVQFHPSYSYEDFVVGIRANATGGFEPRLGAFAQWNKRAAGDGEHRYVLLIEEFTRANLNSVLGELFTYIEHRRRAFDLPVPAEGVDRLQVARNLVIIATLNPRDRSALELDDAMLRRLWLIPFPPDTGQLREMLRSSLVGGGDGPGEADLIAALVGLFDSCRGRADYETLMPFGHGMFAGVR